jgi:hypothetical protein
LLSGCIFGKPQQNIVRPKVEEPVNTIPVSERVYATIDVNKNSKFPLGKEVTVSVFDNKGASKIEYELEAQAGSSVQSGLGSIDPTNEQKPYRKNILLGSCSAGGACSYYQDVKGGTFLLRFVGSSIGNLKGEWSYAAPGNDGKLSSRDAKFQLDAPKLKDAYTIISQTMGVPKSTGDILAGPYYISTTVSSVSEMSLTVHLSEESEKAKLLFWDGSKYKTISSSTSGKTLTAKISAVGTYLATD